MKNSLNLLLVLVLFALSSSRLVAASFSDLTQSVFFDYDDSLWEVVPSPKETAAQADVDRKMTQKTLVTLQRKTADEKYRSRFSVVVDQRKDTFEKYQTYAVDFLKSQRFTVQKEGSRSLPQAGKTFEIVAYQRDFGLTFQQVMVPRNKEVFLLTLSVRTKEFPNYSADMDKMLASFRLGTTVSFNKDR